ncbi:MAG: hypothetical protein AB7F67_04015 [Rhodospirillaceae bacterium]
MITARATLIGLSPYSQSAAHNTPKASPNESADDFERRTWRNKVNADAHGHMFVPPMGLKAALEDAARFRGVRIPGKGLKTFTSHFEAGIMIAAGPIVHDATGLPVRRDTVPGEDVFVNADGKRGGGTRVWRTFPTVPEGWRIEVDYMVLDDMIGQDIFRRTLDDCGKFVGIGRFRPQKRGWYGRFRIETLDWIDDAVAVQAAA